MLSELAAKLSILNAQQHDELEKVKLELTDLNQYGCRPSIEILNIKEKIEQKQKDLEKYV